MKTLRWKVFTLAIGLLFSYQSSAEMAAVADAQSESQVPAQLEEIVITAQKRTERLSDAAVAATVVSPSDLAQNNVGDISDLNKVIPGVQLNSAFNSRVPVAIRGISTIAGLSVGVPTGVSVEVDGIPIPSDTAAANQVEDVARVEVLEGPQVTLGGRTAAAGVINFVTHSPTPVLKGSASLTATTDNEERLNGYLSGPLSDRIQFSIAAYGTHRDFPVVNIATNKHSHQEIEGGRAKLLFNVTDDLDVTLTVHGQETQTRGQNYTYSYLTPGATLLFPGSPLTQSVLLAGISPNRNNEQVNSPAPGIGADYTETDGSIIINKRFGDYTLTSTTQYLEESQTGRQDLFNVATFFWNDLTGGHAPPFYNYQSQVQGAHNAVEELKFLSPADGPITYVAGAFFSDYRVRLHLDRDLIPAEQNIISSSSTKTYDLYDRATFKVAENTNLIVGLRFNHDVIGYDINQIANAPQNPQHSSGDHASSTLVGDITGQQHLTPDAMIYATYSRAYAPNAYDTSQVLANDNPLTPVAATSINHFEIGTKGSFFDHRLRIEAAAWDTVYTNYQVQILQTLPGFINPPQILVAAGKARTRGLEVNSMFAATDTLDLKINSAYIDAKFVDFKDASCYGTQTVAQGCIFDSATGVFSQNLSGRSMPNSPKFKTNFGVDKRYSSPALPFDLLMSGSYAYRTSAIMLPSQNPQSVQSSFGIANLSLTASPKTGHWAATLFVNNLFDHHYVVDEQEFFSAVWSANAVVAQPARDTNRYGGVRFNVSF